MFDKNNPYTLRVEDINDITHYYVSFRDGQADFHETEIDHELYNAFREFEKHDEQQKNFFRRHVEHSDLREETLNKRAVCLPKSIEECICDEERSNAFWLAVGELPQIQRKRFLLYYDGGLTYEQIAEMEGCTKRAIKFSVDIAKEKILEKIKDF
jgi:DNA-directed RNA polymerase specialized sigma subunit, sigma24 homolog